MDEIWFRLTNQLEVLQVEGSVALQHGQQWITTGLAQLQELLEHAYSEEYSRQIQDLGYHLQNWMRRLSEQIQFQYYSIRLNSRALFRQMGTLCFSDVSRREVAFCLAGLGIGTVIGYNIGLRWRETARRVQYMKAIMCHHYIGIEIKRLANWYCVGYSKKKNDGNAKYSNSHRINLWISNIYILLIPENSTNPSTTGVYIKGLPQNGVSLVDDAEVPSIKRSNELLIQVKASSVNVVDAKICHGYSKVYRRLLNSGQQKELPVVLGRDCAGVVAEIGEGVVGFDIGDEVFLATPSWAPGTMAEYIVVTESQVARRPKHVTFEASANLPYSGCLAWDAIVNRSIIEEGDAKGKRVLVYGGCSPVGCILIQLIKLWGGHITTVCKLDATRVIRALGADDIIALDESNIEKELDLHDKYHAIFYTGGHLSDDYILRKRLLPSGSLVSTMPEYLTSDSLGFVCGNIFAGCVRIKLLFQYMFGRNGYQWKEGSRINSAYLEVIRELVDADQLQSVVGAAFRPNHIEQALSHVLSSDAIGGTIIKFQ